MPRAIAQRQLRNVRAHELQIGAREPRLARSPEHEVQREDDEGGDEADADRFAHEAPNVEPLAAADHGIIVRVASEGGAQRVAEAPGRRFVIGAGFVLIPHLQKLGIPN